MVPERHNNVKVLLLMDVGGTMDEHIQRVEELFSGRQSEFKHLEFYWLPQLRLRLHWKNNRAPLCREVPTWDIIRKVQQRLQTHLRGRRHHEPLRESCSPAAAWEYNNEEAGGRMAVKVQRLTNAFPKFAWINPEPQGVWQYRQSISIIQQIVGNRMPLTLKGTGRGHAPAGTSSAVITPDAP